MAAYRIGDVLLPEVGVAGIEYVLRSREASVDLV